jgi:hypothetical protein
VGREPGARETIRRVLPRGYCPRSCEIVAASSSRRPRISAATAGRCRSTTPRPTPGEQYLQSQASVFNAVGVSAEIPAGDVRRS